MQSPEEHKRILELVEKFNKIFEFLLVSLFEKSDAAQYQKVFPDSFFASPVVFSDWVKKCSNRKAIHDFSSDLMRAFAGDEDVFQEFRRAIIGDSGGQNGLINSDITTLQDFLLETPEVFEFLENNIEKLEPAAEEWRQYTKKIKKDSAESYLQRSIECCKNISEMNTDASKQMLLLRAISMAKKYQNINPSANVVSLIEALEHHSAALLKYIETEAPEILDRAREAEAAGQLSEASELYSEAMSIYKKMIGYYKYFPSKLTNAKSCYAEAVQKHNELLINSVEEYRALAESYDNKLDTTDEVYERYILTVKAIGMYENYIIATSNQDPKPVQVIEWAERRVQQLLSYKSQLKEYITQQAPIELESAMQAEDEQDYFEALEGFQTAFEYYKILAEEACGQDDFTQYADAVNNFEGAIDAWEQCYDKLNQLSPSSDLT